MDSDGILMDQDSGSQISFRWWLCSVNLSFSHRTIDVDSSEAEVLFEILDLSGDGSIDKEDREGAHPAAMKSSTQPPGFLHWLKRSYLNHPKMIFFLSKEHDLGMFFQCFHLGKSIRVSIMIKNNLITPLITIIELLTFSMSSNDYHSSCGKTLTYGFQWIVDGKNQWWFISGKTIWITLQQQEKLITTPMV